MTKILVADDEPAVRRLVGSILAEAQAGWKVFEAVDGREALRLALLERPAVALVDLRMPALDGIEVCYRVHERADTAGIAVIVVSARAQRTDIDLAYAAGADDFLAKPLQSAVLIQRVGWLIGG